MPHGLSAAPASVMSTIDDSSGLSYLRLYWNFGGQNWKAVTKSHWSQPFNLIKMLLTSGTACAPLHHVSKHHDFATWLWKECHDLSLKLNEMRSNFLGADYQNGRWFFIIFPSSHQAMKISLTFLLGYTQFSSGFLEDDNGRISAAVPRHHPTGPKLQCRERCRSAA